MRFWILFRLFFGRLFEARFGVFSGGAGNRSNPHIYNGFGRFLHRFWGRFGGLILTSILDFFWSRVLHPFWGSFWGHLFRKLEGHF